MESLFRKAALPLLYGAVLAVSLCQIPAKAAPTTVSKPVLGMVVPGKTTLSEFEDALDRRGCEFDETRLAAVHKDRVKVEEGCFDLPGNPTIVVDASTSSTSDLITRIWIEFQNYQPVSPYDAYFKALKKSYGNPFHIQHESQGERTATWISKPSLLISLEEKDEDGKGSLTYSIGSEAKGLMDRLGLNPSASRQRKPREKPVDKGEADLFKDLGSL